MKEELNYVTILCNEFLQRVFLLPDIIQFEIDKFNKDPNSGKLPSLKSRLLECREELTSINKDLNKINVALNSIANLTPEEQSMFDIMQAQFQRTADQILNTCKKNIYSLETAIATSGIKIVMKTIKVVTENSEKPKPKKEKKPKPKKEKKPKSDEYWKNMIYFFLLIATKIFFLISYIYPIFAVKVTKNWTEIILYNTVSVFILATFIKLLIMQIKFEYLNKPIVFSIIPFYDIFLFLKHAFKE